MKALLALALLAAAPPEPARDASQSDAQEITRVIMAREWRIHAKAKVGPVPCVKREVTRVTFGGPRSSNGDDEQPSPPPPSSPAGTGTPITVLNSNDLWFTPGFRWGRLRDDRNGYTGGGRDLPEEKAKPLSDSASAIRDGPEPPHLIHAIDPLWLRAPLEFCAGDESRPYLDIASPAIRGDTAFVGADFECVICGQGLLFALRKERHGWEIVSVELEWES
jgi:hypothetical protein